MFADVSVSTAVYMALLTHSTCLFGCCMLLLNYRYSILQVCIYIHVCVVSNNRKLVLNVDTKLPG